MSYTTVSAVRYRIDVSETEMEDAKITAFISSADRYIDSVLDDDPKIKKEMIVSTGKEYLDLSEAPIESFSTIFVGGSKWPEIKIINLLNDGECEEEDSTEAAPEYWTDNEAAVGTFTWDTSAFKKYRSLKIENSGSGTSKWSSDAVSVEDSRPYRTTAYVKMDSSFSGSGYIRVSWLDDVNTEITTSDSSAITAAEITQPSAASVLALVSDSSSDTQKAIIYGTVGGVTRSETVILTGTTSVGTNRSFTEITEIVLTSKAVGTITVTSNSAVVTNATFSRDETIKAVWFKVEFDSISPSHAAYAKVELVHAGSAGSIWGDNFSLSRLNYSVDEARGRIWLPDRPFREKDNIIVEYKQAQVPELVQDISTDLASMYALIRLCGGSAAGLNYSIADIDIEKSPQFNNRLRLIFELKMRVKTNLNQLTKIDWREMSIGEVKFPGYVSQAGD